MAKSYNLTFQHILYDISYTNLVLYGAILPSYDSNSKDDEDEVITMDDPRHQDRIENIMKKRN